VAEMDETNSNEALPCHARAKASSELYKMCKQATQDGLQLLPNSERGA
jgi:hypothetical protein